MCKWIISLILIGLMGQVPPSSICPAAIPAPAVEALDAELIAVHFIDVGQADAIYIQLPGDNDILIDGGDTDDGPLVVDYLHSQGMDDALELLIATHPHEDHIGGLPDILAAFQVNEIIDCGLDVRTKTYKQYYAACAAEQCNWRADSHQTLTFGGVELQILTGYEYWSEVNNYSVVARLDCGEVEFLFTGDAEEPVEEILPGDISAEILKVGHHGSDSSSTHDFLARVNPLTAIISVGEDNRYGHPDADTLARLPAAGIEIYRTDINGNICVTTDGISYSIVGK